MVNPTPHAYVRIQRRINKNEKECNEKDFLLRCCYCCFAGSAVTGVGAIANADDDLKQFDKDSIAGGEHVNDAEAYPYSAAPCPSSSEYPSSTSPVPSETPTPEKPPRENVHPLIEGSGAVNCAPGEACIDPETGMAHVEYKVQFAGPSQLSSNHGMTSGRGGEIAIPNVLENIKVTLDSFSPGEDPDTTDFPKEIKEVGAELPIFASDESTLTGYLTEDDLKKNRELFRQTDDTDQWLRNTPVEAYVVSISILPHSDYLKAGRGIGRRV